MQIEKAYLFARQITAGEVPPTHHEHWLYFGGEFNTALMPEGFTNFADELLTYRDNTGTLNYQLNYSNSNFLRNYMETPHIVQLLGNNANSWELTSGILKYVQTGNIPQDADVYNDYHGALLLPVSIPDTFTKAYITFEYVGDIAVDMSQVDLKLRAQGTGGALGARSYADYYPDQIGEYTYSMDITALTQYFVAYRYFQFEPYLKTREIRIKEIWFE